MEKQLETQVRIPAGGAVLDGDMAIPSGATGIVVFAHGSGSSRHSPRNRSVARVIQEAGVGSLLFDLLTREEESVDVFTRHLRFDIELLTARLIEATLWLASQEDTRNLRVGYFGSSTGAAAALMAAARFGSESGPMSGPMSGMDIGAVVSRGGRPDLAGDALPMVQAPTLLIVGGHDELVIELNQDAYARLRCEKELKVIPGATHLFEEPGALEQVADLAAAWFKKRLRSLPAPKSAVSGARQ